MGRFAYATCLRFGSAVSRTARRRRGRWKFVLRRCFVAACVCFSVPGDGVAVEREVDLELVLAVDISQSMDLDEATLQRRGYVSALRHPDVIEGIQRGRLGRIAITYIEWSGEHYQRTLVGWTEIANESSAAAFAEAVERPTLKTAFLDLDQHCDHLCGPKL